MITLKNTLLLLTVSTFVIACYKDNEEELYGIETCEASSVSFQADIMPIIETGCNTVGCHVQGGNAPTIYENYNQIKASVDNGKFETRVLIDKTMPPSAPLTDCQIKYLQKWLDDGAPNN
ncbi:MAG: hypothetical protein R3279_10945 [Putridiphycobacter sp.]|nr:hypothetical protein [Putridiphycobacter sp.]